MPHREYNSERSEVTKKAKRIYLPIDWPDYQRISQEAAVFREWLDQMIETYPELFPASIKWGYVLHDILPASEKMPEVRLRRIRLKGGPGQEPGPVLTIASSAIMPYMTGYTDEVEKPLFLRRFGVPYWALSYVFGRDDSYWYRLETQQGRNEIVGTTVKDPQKLPPHLLGDEKHIHFNGQKGYIATTVGEDCVLGASLSLSADEGGLTAAYTPFKTEARNLDPAYQPQTINIDGWLATRKTWLALFGTITIIECFLHAFLKIRDRCKKQWRTLFPDIRQQVWEIYHAPDADTFRQRAAALHQWSQKHLAGTALEAVEKLVSKTDQFLIAFDFPDAYRTSNMIDRHMLPMDRWLHSIRFFHGHWASAELLIRSWALCHNFGPYCPRAKVAQHFISPAHKLNGFVYHQNWLHNLLISTSAVGLNTDHRKRQN